MAYIYKKNIGGKDYYYLRVSSKKGPKSLTKDIAYLGDDPNKIKERLERLPAKHSKEIRKTYKTINKFIEVNRYLSRIRETKLKEDTHLKRADLEEIEAAKLHFNTIFKRKDRLTQEETLKRFIVEFAFNTTAIEGNTITLQQAHRLLVDNLTPKNKTLREIYDLQNTDKVFTEIFNDMEKKEINHELIHKMHSDLLQNIDQRQGYRKEEVRIFKMNFRSTPHQYIYTDMNILLDWYSKNQNRLHPLALAAIFHHKFEKIHPFMDGNGRTGRMLMNLIMLNNRYPPIIIKKKNRQEYLQALNNADKAKTTDDQQYKKLIDMTAQELTSSYWNIFL
ncbi:Fic family protein [Candidatus Woesearchaeota archaeon]|nr:Fic family protein [Candidatus Woesearchaeota archaeon]